ncbi:hypothetical protein D3C85_1622460 [compost metagenome]
MDAFRQLQGQRQEFCLVGLPVLEHLDQPASVGWQQFGGDLGEGPMLAADFDDRGGLALMADRGKGKGHAVRPLQID